MISFHEIGRKTYERPVIKDLIFNVYRDVPRKNKAVAGMIGVTGDCMYVACTACFVNLI